MQKNNTVPNGLAARDALFDNIRFILIFLVVLGHTLSPIGKQPDAIQLIYKFIYLFHMPAFMLLSGYFSKNVEKCRDTAVQKYLLPYLIFNLLSSVIYLYQGGKAWYVLDIFYPRWGIWFLLVLFVYRFVLKDLVRIRLMLPLSFVIGLLAGCFDKLDSDFAWGRIFGFLPFFILGYYLTAEHIEKIRKLPKYIPVLTGLLSVGFILFTHFNQKYDWTSFLNFSHQMYFLRDSYRECGLGTFDGLICRAAIYLFALLITFTLIALTPRKKTYLATVGKNTMTVYILHLFILNEIKDLSIWPKPGYLVLLCGFAVAAAFVFLFSAPPVAKAYSFCIEKLEKLIFRPTLPKS